MSDRVEIKNTNNAAESTSESAASTAPSVSSTVAGKFTTVTALRTTSNLSQTAPILIFISSPTWFKTVFNSRSHHFLHTKPILYSSPILCTSTCLYNTEHSSAPLLCYTLYLNTFSRTIMPISRCHEIQHYPSVTTISHSPCPVPHSNPFSLFYHITLSCPFPLQSCSISHRISSFQPQQLQLAWLRNPSAQLHAPSSLLLHKVGRDLPVCVLCVLCMVDWEMEWSVQDVVMV